MNTNHSLFPHTPCTPVVALPLGEGVTQASQASQASSRYRERDFGIGYGTSSGYALDKRYTSDWGSPRFRFS